MNWTDVDTTHCGVAACAELIGDHWSVLIMRDVLAGVGRFQDLQTHTGASTAVLSKRLRGLCEAGVLEAEAYRRPGERERVAYKPTAKGLALAPVIVAMAQFGYDQLVSTPDPLVEYFDAKTGQPVRVGFVREDGAPIAPQDLTFRVDPAAHAPGYAAPPSRKRARPGG